VNSYEALGITGKPGANPKLPPATIPQPNGRRVH
jgi:hypothetical protein